MLSRYMVLHNTAKELSIVMLSFTTLFIKDIGKIKKIQLCEMWVYYLEDYWVIWKLDLYVFVASN